MISLCLYFFRETLSQTFNTEVKHQRQLQVVGIHLSSGYEREHLLTLNMEEVKQTLNQRKLEASSKSMEYSPILPVYKWREIHKDRKRS